MASHDGRGSPPDPALDNAQPVQTSVDEPIESETESGSSYAGTASGMGSPACPYRNSRVYDQECALFFDCPSHQVERAPAGSDEPDSESIDQRLAPDNAADVLSNGTEETTTTADVLGPESATDKPDSENPPLETSHPGPSSINNSGMQVDIAREERDVTAEVDTNVQSMNIGRSATQNEPSAQTDPAPEPGPEQPTSHAPELTISSGASSSSSRSSLQQATPSLRPRETSQPQSLISAIALRQAESRSNMDVILPPWQPDSEVSSCPICHVDFRFYIRKHHCRKCGRVVCNSCSPHRITIPNQYIVRAPGELSSAATLDMYGGEGGIADFNFSLGGGERVRLCNPCVPDPNMTPPQPQLSPRNPPYHQEAPRSGHQRSQSSVGGTGYFYRGASGLQSPPVSAGPRPVGSTSSRSRSATLNHLPSHVASERAADAARMRAGLSPFPYGGGPRSPPNRALQSRQEFLQNYYYPGTSSPSANRFTFGGQRATASSSRTPSNMDRPLPLPPPPPQIPEEDQCPICHHELPSRSLPEVERLREEHITACISDHTSHRPGTSLGQGGTPGTSPARALRRTGLISYIATEKDCASDEECAICFEEFEPGAKMARLECWCRFHYECIAEWFGRRDGRCPVHQHDSYGY